MLKEALQKKIESPSGSRKVIPDRNGMKNMKGNEGMKGMNE